MHYINIHRTRKPSPKPYWSIPFLIPWSSKWQDTRHSFNCSFSLDSASMSPRNDQVRKQVYRASWLYWLLHSITSAIQEIWIQIFAGFKISSTSFWIISISLPNLDIWNLSAHYGLSGVTLRRCTYFQGPSQPLTAVSATVQKIVAVVLLRVITVATDTTNQLASNA
jgi:hypothetical protein